MKHEIENFFIKQRIHLENYAAHEMLCESIL